MEMMLLFSILCIAIQLLRIISSQESICESKYASSTRCYVDYGTQLSNIYTRSMVECTNICNLDTECQSVFYDSNSRQCRTNSGVLSSTISCSNPIKYAQITQTSCLGQSSMGEQCTSSSECSDVTGTQCRDGVCKCIVGLSYHDITRQCLADCGSYGYGRTFQEISEAIMMGFFNYDFRPMDGPGCKALCLNETRFVCRTAEAYVASNGVQGCQLSWETFYTNPEAYTVSGASVTYLRNCA